MVCAVLAIAVFTGIAHAANRTEARVLFIGNSLTYVNDLPSAFASLAPPGVHVQVDMIARGGAALADHVDDAIVSDALAQGRCTDVILQERGVLAPTCWHRGFELERHFVVPWGGLVLPLEWSF